MAFNVSAGRTRPKLLPIPENFVDDKRLATTARQFLDHIIRYDTIKRAELERGWNRARLYDRNLQWVKPLYGAGGGRLWFQWEPIRFAKSDAKFPMPTRNVFSPAMQDEVARLVGVGSKPYVRVDDPEKEEGAIAGKQVLLDRNEKTGFDKQNRVGCYHAAMFGQWIETSRWETNLLKTTRGPKTTIAACPECRFLLSEPQVTEPGAAQVRAMNPAGVSRMRNDAGKEWDEISACPSCNKPMRPVEPPKDIYLNQKDSLGRDLFKDRATGEDVTECDSPYSFFPGNEGVGYETDEEMEEYALRTIRSLDYLKLRWENAGEVKAEVHMSAMQHHPVLGHHGLSISGEGRWSNHAVEDVFVLKPNIDFERGLLIAMAGATLLFYGELFVPGTDVPRVETKVAQWELREGEIWGKSLGEDLFSVQDNINSGLSQAMDLQQKWTNPKVILHEGMNLQFAGGSGDRYAGDIWTVNMRGMPEHVAARFPFVFGDKGAPGSLWQMFDRDKEHIADATGARGAEVGNVSGVELNYSALLFAAQKSAERRRPRTDGIRALKRGIWTHRLRLIAALYQEDRLVHYRDDSEKWKVRQLRGFSLKGQTDVTLEDEPIVDSGIAKRASIQQGLDWQTIRTSANGGSYGADRRINRAIGVPEELNEDRNQQEDLAMEEWRLWSEEDVEPAIDQQGDDHLIHYNCHTLNMNSREAKDLKEQLRDPKWANVVRDLTWARVLQATWDWERLLDDLQGKAQMLEMARNPPPLDLATPQELQMIQTKLAEAAQAVKGFPVPLELQIHDCWLRLLEAHQVKVEAIPPLAKLVRMKAHALGAWRLLKMSMAPPPMAPGAPAPAPTGPGAPPTMAETAGAPAPA